MGWNESICGMIRKARTTCRSFFEEELSDNGSGDDSDASDEEGSGYGSDEDSIGEEVDV